MVAAEKQTQPTETYHKSYNIFTREGRRNAVVWGLNKKLLLPHEIEADPDAIERARQLRSEGYGIIVPYTHPDMRSPIDAVKAIISLGDKFDDAMYVGPLAWHQQHYPHLKALSKITGIPLLPIVTSNTRERGKDYEVFSITEKMLREGKKLIGKDVPEPKQVGIRHGLFEYLNQGAKVLNEGGIVFIAPQGGRKNELGEPLTAVEMLVRQTKKYHRNNTDATESDPLRVAIWPVSVTPRDVLEYSDKTAGMNWRVVEEVVFGDIKTLDEIEEEITTYDTSKQVIADTVVFEEFRKIAPIPYLNDAESVAA